jgi:hypothetical protein
MAQVYSDPRPGGRSAAHRFDQHVIGGGKLLNLGMFALHLSRPESAASPRFFRISYAQLDRHAHAVTSEFHSNHERGNRGRLFGF